VPPTSAAAWIVVGVLGAVFVCIGAVALGALLATSQMVVTDRELVAKAALVAGGGGFLVLLVALAQSAPPR